MATKVFDSEEAAAYYDNAAVADFYQQCWGGEDIHIGHYPTGNESVKQASAAMTRHLLEFAGITGGDRVLDIACGYGGTLRMLARMGCQAKGIDISEICVNRANALTSAAGLSDRIETVTGDFHHIDSAADTWDGVICQEAIIHSDNRPAVFAEALRILRPGGVFAFSDILTGHNADISMVEAAFARLGASAGATVGDYQVMAQSAGFVDIQAEERLADIKTHYNKLAAELSEPVPGLDANAQLAIGQSISRWQAALAEGHITWACFVARKPV
ncbi:MAG: methyltransferase domain-containing protein [Gammaproteobacteria bacterium]|nr:methyltransferase domain-containing protein [Gammaproteobacteria bacterium]